MITELLPRLCLSAMLIFSGWIGVGRPSAAAGITYYVSSSLGNDSNDGRSADHPLRTIGRVNALALQPGDRVLFRCGDQWRADPLIVTRSGSAGNPVTFGSYPASDCDDRPVLSGAQPVAGWSVYSGNIYAADLSAGANAGKFGNGINQLFRNGVRLTMGRWPNLDAGDGGYSTVDGYTADRTLIDSALPAQNWAGAVIHLKAMRWYLVNRVVATSGTGSLTLEKETRCWGGSCTGWGYFINNHLQTLDRDGEWYYDAAAHKLYLYATGGKPADGVIEGSVILRQDDRAWGGVVLGTDLGDPVSDVVVENLAVVRWYANGITLPTNYRANDGTRLALRRNRIQDVDNAGIQLAVWVYSAQDGIDGWRGGSAVELRENWIEGANHFGIDGYMRNSVIAGNQVRDVALIKNLGRSGMGCGYEGSNCTENGDGIRIKLDRVERSAYGNRLEGNHLERIGYNGVDVFGPSNTLENNVIVQACYSKGDCGAVRTFGDSSLATTAVHDGVIRNNIFVDIPGNTDGTHPNYRPLFGFGAYIDHYSRDMVVSGNTIISATAAGILFQDSSGTIENNTLYANSAGSATSGQVAISPADARIAAFQHNILFAIRDNARTLTLSSRDNLIVSDDNDFFHPYRSRHIEANGAKTLAEWRAYSGRDAHSRSSWYTQTVGEAPRSAIFYNPTGNSITVDLGTERYLDLSQQEIAGSVTLPPYGSRILIRDLRRAFAFSDLNFGLQPVGETSAVQRIDFQNVSGNPLELNSITVNGDYVQSNDCPVPPATLAPNAGCTFQLAFQPGVLGLRTGMLSVVAGSAPTYTVRLSGTGVMTVTRTYLPAVLKKGR